MKADFSTANPTSAYDTANFGKVRPGTDGMPAWSHLSSPTPPSRKHHTPQGLTLRQVQVEIVNKDVIANPITGEGPEAAGKKALAAAAQLEKDGGTYASRAFANFGKWRSGQATDETRRFDLQQACCTCLWWRGGKRRRLSDACFLSSLYFCSRCSFPRLGCCICPYSHVSCSDLNGFCPSLDDRVRSCVLFPPVRFSVPLYCSIGDFSLCLFRSAFCSLRIRACTGFSLCSASRCSTCATMLPARPARHLVLRPSLYLSSRLTTPSHYFRPPLQLSLFITL